MNTEEIHRIQKQIESLQEGIYLLHGEISMTQSGEVESSLWSQVSDMEQEIQRLSSNLPDSERE